IKIHAAVDAALAKMTVKRWIVAVLVVQLPELAQVVADLFRRYRGILPSWPGIRFAGHKGGGAQPGFANLPDVVLLFFIHEQFHAGRVGALFEIIHQAVRLFDRLLLCAAADFHHEPAFTFWQQGQVLAVGAALLLDIFYEAVVEALQRDGRVLQHLGNVVPCLVHIRVAEQEDYALGMVVDELDLGFQDSNAGALGTYQGACQVDAAVLVGYELVEVVAGNAADNFGKILLDQRLVALAKRHQLGINLSLAVGPAHALLPLSLRKPAGLEASAVVEQNVHFFGIVYRRAVHLRVRPAGVVAQHATEHAAAVGGGLRAPGQMVGTRGLDQVIADGSRLDAGVLLSRIEFQDVVQVLGEVNHQADVAALSGQAGAAAPG